MDLIWVGGQVMIAGPDRRASVYTGRAGARLTGLRLAPGFAPSVIGMPASEFTDRRVLLAEVWPASAVDSLVDRLGLSVDPGTGLEDLVLGRGLTPDPTVVEIVRQVRRGESIASVAEAVGYSDRQLHRRCLEAFGYGAKRLARILRLERALELARQGARYADTASVAGYADQAHLARDVSELAGVTLSQLLAESGNGEYRSTELPSGSCTTA